MKIDRLKAKCKGAQPPADVQNLIKELQTSAAQGHDVLAQKLSSIQVWKYSKSDFYYWHDIVDLFDDILAEATAGVSGTNAAVSDDADVSLRWYMQVDMPQNNSLRSVVCEILHFFSLLIENTFSRSSFSSIDRLYGLLFSDNLFVVYNVLVLLYTFARRSNLFGRLQDKQKRDIFSVLHMLASPWPSTGFTLAVCCSHRQSLPPDATTVKFQATAKPPSSTDMNAGCESAAEGRRIVIDANITDQAELPTAQIMHNLLKQNGQQHMSNTSDATVVPVLDENREQKLFLLTRLAKHFTNPTSRVMNVQVRLQALTVLLHNNALSQPKKFLYNSFLEELVDILKLDEDDLADIKTCVLRTLTAIIHYNNAEPDRLNSVLQATGLASPYGTIPSIVRDCVNYLTVKNADDGNDSSASGAANHKAALARRFPVQYTTAIFSFLYHISNYGSGIDALTNADMMQTMLRIINHYESTDESLGFATRAVRVVDLLANNNLTLFRNANGFVCMTARLAHEVQCCLQESQKQQQEQQPSTTAVHTCHPQRAALMKSALSFLKKAFPDAAFNDHANLRDVFGEETRNALKSIVERCEFFGPSLFLMTLDVITSFINAEPASLSDFQASGLTKAILDAVFTRKLPATREIIQSLPHTCNALCTNARGVEEFRAVAPFDRICHILLSEEYLPALRRKKTGTVDARLRGGNEPAHALGGTLEQLAQHYPALRQDAMRAVVNMLNRLVEIGNAPLNLNSTSAPAKAPDLAVPGLADIMNHPALQQLQQVDQNNLAAAVAGFAAAMNSGDAQLNAALRNVGSATVMQLRQQLNQMNASSSQLTPASQQQQPAQPSPAHRHPLMLDDPGLGLRHNESVQSMGGNAVDLIDFDQDDDESSTPTFSPPGTLYDLGSLSSGPATAASTSEAALPPPPPPPPVVAVSVLDADQPSDSNGGDAEMIDQSNVQPPSTPTPQVQNEAVATAAVTHQSNAGSSSSALAADPAPPPPLASSAVDMDSPDFLDHDMAESARVIANILGSVSTASSSAAVSQQPINYSTASIQSEQQPVPSLSPPAIAVQSSASLAEIVSNVACFTDAFINNVNMRPDATARNVQDFAGQNGIKAVVALLKLNNVSLDFPIHGASSALAKLVRTIHNGWSNAVAASGLLLSGGGGAGKLLDDILESLRTLIDDAVRMMRSNLSEESSSHENATSQTALARELLSVRACTLASQKAMLKYSTAYSDAAGFNVAERCPLAQKLSQIHTHVYVLSSLCRSSARHIGSSSTNNITSTFVLNSSTPQLVSYMIALYDMLVWESISLLSMSEYQSPQQQRRSNTSTTSVLPSATVPAAVTAPFSIENLLFNGNSSVGSAPVPLDTPTAANIDSNFGQQSSSVPSVSSASQSATASSFSLTDALNLMVNAAAAATSSTSSAVGSSAATNTIPPLPAAATAPSLHDNTATTSTNSKSRGEISKLVQPTLAIVTKLSCAVSDLLQAVCRMPYQQQLQQRQRRNRQGALMQQAQQQGLLAQANERLFKTLAVSMKQSLLWEPPGKSNNETNDDDSSSPASRRRNDMRHMYLACMVTMLRKMLVSDSRQAFGDTLQAMIREGTLDVCSKLYYWSLQPLNIVNGGATASNSDDIADISDDAERHQTSGGENKAAPVMSSAQCEFLSHWLELAQLLANKRVVVDAPHSVTPLSGTNSPARGSEQPRSTPSAVTPEQTAANNRDALVAVHKYIVPVLKQFYQHTEMYCTLPSPIPAHYFSLLRAVLSSSDLVTAHLARQQSQVAVLQPVTTDSQSSSSTAITSSSENATSSSSTGAAGQLPSTSSTAGVNGWGTLPPVAEVAGDSNMSTSSASSNPEPSFAEFIAAATAALAAGTSCSSTAAGPATTAPAVSSTAAADSSSAVAPAANQPPSQPPTAADVEHQRQTAITSVCEMGFDRPTAIRALHLNEWQVEAAVNLLLTLGPAQLQAMAAVYDDDDDLMESIERYSAPAPPPPPPFPSHLMPSGTSRAVAAAGQSGATSATIDVSRSGSSSNATETLNEAADVKQTVAVCQANLDENDYKFLRSDVVPLINIMSFLAGSGGASLSFSSRPPQAATASTTKYSADIVFRVVDIVQLCARQNGPEWRERLITLVVERIVEHVEYVTRAFRGGVEASAEPDKLVQTIQQFDQTEPTSVKLEAFMHFAALLLEKSSGKPYWHVIFNAKSSKNDSDQPLFQQFHQALMSLVSTARYVLQQVKSGAAQAPQWLTLAFILLDLSDRQCLAQQRNAHARQRYTNGRWKYFDVKTSRWLPFDAAQSEAINKAFNEGKNDAQITFTESGTSTTAQQSQRNTPYSTVYFDHMVMVNHRTNSRRAVMPELDEFDETYDAIKKSKIAKSSGTSSAGMKAPASTPSDLGKTGSKRDDSLRSASNSDSKDALHKKRQKSSSDSSMQSQQPSPATRRTVKSLKRAHVGGMRTGGIPKNTPAGKSAQRAPANKTPVPLTNKTSAGSGKQAGPTSQNDVATSSSPSSDDCFAPPYSISSLSKDEQHTVMLDSIELIKTGEPLLLNAIMRYMLRLTRSPSNAMFFVKSGGLRALFSLTRAAYFPEFTSLLTHIVRHVIEQPPVLIKRMVDVVDFILHNVYSKAISSSSVQGTTAGPSVNDLNNDLFIALNRLWPAALRSPYMMGQVAKRLMGVTAMPGASAASDTAANFASGDRSTPSINEKLIVERRPAASQQQNVQPPRTARVNLPPSSAGLPASGRTPLRPSTTPSSRPEYNRANSTGAQFSFDAITNCDSPATAAATGGGGGGSLNGNSFEELFMRHSDQVSYDATVRDVVENLLSLLLIRPSQQQARQQDISSPSSVPPPPAAVSANEDALMDVDPSGTTASATSTATTRNVTKPKAFYDSNQQSGSCVLSPSNVLDMLAHLLQQYPLVLTHIANAVVVESSTGALPRVTTLLAASMDETIAKSTVRADETIMEANDVGGDSSSSQMNATDKITSAVTYILDNLLTERDLMAQAIRDELTSMSAQEVLHASRSVLDAEAASINSRRNNTTLSGVSGAAASSSTSQSVPPAGAAAAASSDVSGVRSAPPPPTLITTNGSNTAAHYSQDDIEDCCASVQYLFRAIASTTEAPNSQFRVVEDIRKLFGVYAERLFSSSRDNTDKSNGSASTTNRANTANGMVVDGNSLPSPEELEKSLPTRTSTTNNEHNEKASTLSAGDIAHKLKALCVVVHLMLTHAQSESMPAGEALAHASKNKRILAKIVHAAASNTVARLVVKSGLARDLGRVLTYCNMNSTYFGSLANALLKPIELLSYQATLTLANNVVSYSSSSLVRTPSTSTTTKSNRQSPRKDASSMQRTMSAQHQQQHPVQDLQQLSTVSNNNNNSAGIDILNDSIVSDLDASTSGDDDQDIGGADVAGNGGNANTNGMVGRDNNPVAIQIDHDQFSAAVESMQQYRAEQQRHNLDVMDAMEDEDIGVDFGAVPMSNGGDRRRQNGRRSNRSTEVVTVAGMAGLIDEVQAQLNAAGAPADDGGLAGEIAAAIVDESVAAVGGNAAHVIGGHISVDDDEVDFDDDDGNEEIDESSANGARSNDDDREAGAEVGGDDDERSRELGDDEDDHSEDDEEDNDDDDDDEDDEDDDNDDDDVDDDDEDANEAVIQPYHLSEAALRAEAEFGNTADEDDEDDSLADEYEDAQDENSFTSEYDDDDDDDDENDDETLIANGGGAAGGDNSLLGAVRNVAELYFDQQANYSTAELDELVDSFQNMQQNSGVGGGVGYRQRASRQLLMPFADSDDVEQRLFETTMQTLAAGLRTDSSAPGSRQWAIRTGGPPGGGMVSSSHHQPHHPQPHSSHHTYQQHRTHRMFVPATSSPLPLSHPLLLPPRTATSGGGTEVDYSISAAGGTSRTTTMMMNHPFIESGMSASVELGPMMRDAVGGGPVSTASVQMIDSNGNPLPPSVAQAWAPSLLRLAAGAAGPIHGGNVRIEVVAMRGNPPHPLPSASSSRTGGVNPNHHVHRLAVHDSASGRNRTVSAAAVAPAGRVGQSSSVGPSSSLPANVGSSTDAAGASSNAPVATNFAENASNLNDEAAVQQQHDQEQRRSAASVSMLMRMLGFTPAASSQLASPQDFSSPPVNNLINATPDVMSADAMFLESQMRMPILSRHMPRHANAVSERELLAAAIGYDPAVVAASGGPSAAGGAGASTAGVASVSQSELAANYAVIAEEAARNLPIPLQDLYVVNPTTAANASTTAGSSAQDLQNGGVGSTRDMTFSQLLRQQHAHRPMMASPNMYMMPDRYLSALTGGIGAVAAAHPRPTPNAGTAGSTSTSASRSAGAAPPLPLNKLRRATMCSLLRSWSESGWTCEAHEYLTVINMLRPALAMHIIRYKLEFNKRVLTQAAAAATVKADAAATAVDSVRESVADADHPQAALADITEPASEISSAESQPLRAVSTDATASTPSVVVLQPDASAGDSDAQRTARHDDMRHQAFVQAMESLNAAGVDVPADARELRIAEGSVVNAAERIDDDDDTDETSDDYAALSATLAASASRLSAANESIAASLRSLVEASNLMTAASADDQPMLISDAAVEMVSVDMPEVASQSAGAADEQAVTIGRDAMPADVASATVAVEQNMAIPVPSEEVRGVQAQMPIAIDDLSEVVPASPDPASNLSITQAVNTAADAASAFMSNAENALAEQPENADVIMTPAADASPAPINDAVPAAATPAVPAHPDDDLPDELPAEFLRELPEDMRNELVSQHRRTIRLRDERRRRIQQQQQQAAAAQAAGSSSGGASTAGGDISMPDVSEVDPDILAQLPQEIQEEVLAQQRAAAAARQERESIAAGSASSAAGGSSGSGGAASSSANDPAAFFSTLAPDLRRQVLMDMDDSQLSTLSENLRQEAQTLRRSNPRRFAHHTQEEMLARLEAEQQALEQAAAGVGRARRMVASMANAAGLSSSSTATTAGVGRLRAYALAGAGGLGSLGISSLLAEDAARLADDGVISTELFNNWYSATTLDSNSRTGILASTTSAAGQTNTSRHDRLSGRPGLSSAFEAAAGLPSALVQRQGGNRYILAENAAIRPVQPRRNVGFMPSASLIPPPPAVSAPPSSSKPVFGRQVFDLEGLTCLTMILTACSSTSADNLDLARLQRILRNLCLHGPTRQFVIASLVSLLNKCGQTSHETTTTSVAGDDSQKAGMKLKWLSLRSNASNNNSSATSANSGHAVIETDDAMIIDLTAPSAGETARPSTSSLAPAAAAKLTTIFTVCNPFENNGVAVKMTASAEALFAVHPEAASFLCQLLLGTLHFLAQHFPDSLLPLVITRNFDLRTCNVAVAQKSSSHTNVTDSDGSLLGLKSALSGSSVHSSTISPLKQQQQQYGGRHATGSRRGVRGGPTVTSVAAPPTTNNDMSIRPINTGTMQTQQQQPQTIWDIALRIELCHHQQQQQLPASGGSSDSTANLTKEFNDTAAAAQTITRHSTVLVPQIPAHMQLLLTNNNNDTQPNNKISSKFTAPTTSSQNRQQPSKPAVDADTEFLNSLVPFQYPLVQSVTMAESPLASVIKLLNQPLACTGSDGVTDAVLRCCKLLFSSLKQREVVVPMRASALVAHIERSQQSLTARKAALLGSQQQAGAALAPLKPKNNSASRAIADTASTSIASGDAAAISTELGQVTAAGPVAEQVSTDEKQTATPLSTVASSGTNDAAKRTNFSDLPSLLAATKSEHMMRSTQVVPERLYAHSVVIDNSPTASSNMTPTAAAISECFDTVVSVYASRRVRSLVVDGSQRTRKALLSSEDSHNNVDNEQETIVSGLECLVEPFEFGTATSQPASSSVAETTDESSSVTTQCVEALQKLAVMIDLQAYSTRVVMSVKRDENFNSSNATRALLMDNDRIDALVEQATRDFTAQRLPEIVRRETSSAGKTSARSLLACLAVELRQNDEISMLLKELMQCLHRQPRRAGQLGLLDACAILGRACEKLGFASRATSLQLLVSSLIDLTLKEVLTDLEQYNEEVCKRLAEKQQQQQANSTTKQQGRTLNSADTGRSTAPTAAAEGGENPPIMPRLPQPAARRAAPGIFGGGGRGGMPSTAPPTCQFSFNAASKFTSKNSAQLGVYSLLKAALQCRSRFFANRQAYDVYYLTPNSTINSILGNVINDYVHYVEKVLHDECMQATSHVYTAPAAEPMDVDVTVAVVDAAVNDRPVTAAEVATAADAAAATTRPSPASASSSQPQSASLQRAPPPAGFNIEPPAIESLPQLNAIQKVWEMLSQTLANLEELGDTGSALLLLPLVESFFLLYAPQPMNVLYGPITSSLVELFSSTSGQWTMAYGGPHSRRGAAAAAAAAHQQYLFGNAAGGGAQSGSLSALQQLQMLNPFGTSSTQPAGTAAGGAGDAGNAAQFLFGHYQRPAAGGAGAAAAGGRASHLADMAPGGPTRSYQMAMATALGRAGGAGGNGPNSASSAVITDNSFRRFFGTQTSVMAANAAAATALSSSLNDAVRPNGAAGGSMAQQAHPAVIDIESYAGDLHGSSSTGADQQQQQSNETLATTSSGGSASASSATAALNPNDVLPVYSQNNMMMLITFAERHKTLINEILRYSSVHITESPFAVLISLTRVLDFDVKRRFFRQQLDIVDRMSSASRAAQLRGMGRFADTVLRVRRGSVFEDSFRDLHRGGPDKWRSRFYIIFENEEGQDAGGLLREWYTIMAREIFNPMYGLFKTSPGDRATHMINPASYINSNHLSYFKFVGRFIAKAILDNKLLDCFFTRSFYKHMLGKPVRYTDMESEDPDFYNGLIYLLTHKVSELGYELTFSTEVQEYGVTQIGDLKPNGRNMPVTDENKNEYVPLVCQMKMTHAIKQQLKSFLEGFYELIPSHLISMFNEQELELLISGMPQIDVDDLRINTDYHRYDSTSPQIAWFWQALKSFQQEERAKFLQFVTGTSKVPLQGFAALEGMNGTQKLQVFRDDRGTDRLPCAHTCFNQLDLPPYETYDKLRQMLLYAVNECSEGFGFA